MLRQTALRLISVIGYSMSLSSLFIATLLLGMLRSVVGSRGVSDGNKENNLICMEMEDLP